MFGLKLESKGFVNMWKIPGPGVTWFSIAVEGLSNSVNMHFCLFGYQIFDVTVIKK